MALPQPADEQPLKRRRTDDGGGDTQGPSPRYVEDKDLWLDDGNIIISAGADPAHLFKCHKSVLTRNSPVFDEMFGVALTGEVYEGVPVVPLPDDVDDVRRLIRMLYDPM